MTRNNPSTRRHRIVAILTAWVFVFGGMQAALAKNGNGSNGHSGMQSMKSDMKSSMKSGKSDHDGKKHKDKDDGKYTEKKKHKGNDKGTTTTSTGTDKGTGTGKGTCTTTGTGTQKAPVIVNGGLILDKLPNGTAYYRRATKAEIDEAAKAGGSTAATGSNGATTPGAGGTTASTGAGTPLGHIENVDQVVRDHRPGGNSGGPVPGTIIRDHTTGGDSTPRIVVSNSGGVLVTRKATDAELVKARLKEAPAPQEVPIGMSSGGR